MGRGSKRDSQFAEMIEIACRLEKPVRIGVNWGSLDQDLLARLMDENNALPQPASAQSVMREAIVRSAIDSAALAVSLGLPREKIILSAKVSGVQDLIAVYRSLAARCDYPLHLGLTEAGMGSKGIVASTAGIGVLLAEGIGDTIRVSLDARTRRRPHAGSHRRAGNPADHGPALLPAHGGGLPRLRPHHQHLFPGTGTAHPGPHPPSHARLARRT